MTAGDHAHPQPSGEASEAAMVGVADVTRAEERERIARDLHDVGVQSLVGIGMHLARIAAASGERGVRDELSRAIDELDGVIARTREYILLLRPRVVGQRTLLDSLTRVSHEAQQGFGLQVELCVDCCIAERFASSASELVKIVREALSNASRHGHARHCVVVLEGRSGGAVLIVKDDGCGFGHSRRSGHGLTNMRERAATLGGTLRVHTGREGSAVEVHLPGPRDGDLRSGL